MVQSPLKLGFSCHDPLWQANDFLNITLSIIILNKYNNDALRHCKILGNKFVHAVFIHAVLVHAKRFLNATETVK